MRRPWPWLRAMGGSGLLVLLGWQLGSDAMVAGLRVIDAPAAVAAVLLGLATTALSAWRWCLVSRRLGLRLPFAVAVAECHRAQLLNSVLPAGVLGDVHRGVRHGRRARDMGNGVRTVAVERVIGLAVLVIGGAMVLLAHPMLSTARTGPALTVGAVTAIGLGGAVVLLLARGGWPAIAALSLAAVVGHVTLFVIAARAAGVAAPLVELVPLVALALLAMGLPVSVGGWGPREAVCALAFGAAGIGAAQGLTTSVAYGTLALISCLPGAVVLLAPAGQRVRLSVRTAWYSAKDAAKLASTARPFSADASDGRPTTPDSV